MPEKKGFLLIDRNLLDSPVYQSKPFDPLHAWIDILMLASWSDREVYWMDSIVKLKRGQLITSLRYLGSKWGWSPKKVTRWLGVWSGQGSIRTQQGKHTGTLITVCSYEHYQDMSLGRKQEEKRKRNTKETPRKQKELSKPSKPKLKDRRFSSSDAKEIIGFINDKTNKRYQFVESNIRPIVKRLNELDASGFSNPKRVCCQIIVGKLKDPDFPSKYVRVKTIFVRNWEEYLAELGTDQNPNSAKNGKFVSGSKGQFFDDRSPRPAPPAPPAPSPPADRVAEKLLGSALGELRPDVDGHLFDVWLSPLTRAWIRGDELVVIVPNLIFKETIQNRYAEDIQRLASNLHGSPVRVRLELTMAA
jgi:hypothetical protein